MTSPQGSPTDHSRSPSQPFLQGIGLAPMEGVTDFPTRLWFRLTSGPDYLVTPFLRVTGTYPSGELPLPWAPEILHPGVRDALACSPTLAQLMAADPQRFAEVAATLLDHTPMVEINCGCPAPTVVGKGAGSGLLQEPRYFGDFLRSASARLGRDRLSVKMRLGYDSSEAFPELLAEMQELALGRLVVHGRTKRDRYSGKARWDLIAQAAQGLGPSVPVVGSGDITHLGSFEQRRTIAEQTSGVLIGRGALRNPWIFREIRQGSPVHLSFGLVKQALLAYALLWESFYQDFAGLLKLVTDGRFFTQTLGLHEDAWRPLNTALSKLLAPAHGIAEQPPVVSLKTLGRLKMLWNYWRSSLPEVFFAPHLLRSRSLAEFLQQLTALYENSFPPDSRQQDLPLTWNPALDWLYAGEKRPDQTILA